MSTRTEWENTVNHIEGSIDSLRKNEAKHIARGVETNAMYQIISDAEKQIGKMTNNLER